MFGNENDNEPKIYTDLPPEVKEKKEKNMTLIIGIMAVSVVLLVVLYNLIVNNPFNRIHKFSSTTHPGFNQMGDTTSRTTTTKAQRSTTTRVVDYKTGEILNNVNDIVFVLKVDGYEQGDSVKYDLKEGLELVFKMRSSKNGVFYFELHHGGKKWLTQKIAPTDRIEVFSIGDALIYINKDTTNAEYNKIYIKQGLNKYELLELESIDGMKPDTIEIFGDKLVIRASRLNGTNLRYGAVPDIDICNRDSWKMGVNDDTVVTTTYTYNLNGKNLIMTPINSEIVTLSQYLVIKNTVCG